MYAHIHIHSHIPVGHAFLTCVHVRVGRGWVQGFETQEVIARPTGAFNLDTLYCHAKKCLHNVLII